MSKTVWIVNQYASTPTAGMGGRHYYLARELAKQGYNVYLIASSANHLLREQQVFDGTFKLEEVEGFTFVWVRMPKYEEAHSKQRAINWFLFPWRLQKLRKVISDVPDAILCSSPSPIAFLGAQRLAKKFQARLLFEVRDIWPLTLTEIGGYSPSHPFIRLMQWVEDKAYRDSDQVISNLKNAVEHMASRGMNREKFTWVPNGFSMDEVSLGTPLNERTASQVPSGKFLVGYTGTIGVANALETFLQAAEQLLEYSEIVFVLVGGGKEKDALQKIASKKKLINVHFIDSIPKVEIQAVLSRFDVCYIGLTKDPLFKFGVSPNKLFDYFYSSKPIVYAIDSGDYKPVAVSQSGIEVPAEDAAALAGAIVKLYQMSPLERQAMGDNGRKEAVERYEYGQLALSLAEKLFN
ncbi:MAG: glycosyltransferase family 4 protein [Halopseudomonas sabulinigri]